MAPKHDFTHSKGTHTTQQINRSTRFSHIMKVIIYSLVLLVTYARKLRAAQRQQQVSVKVEIAFRDRYYFRYAPPHARENQTLSSTRHFLPIYPRRHICTSQKCFCTTLIPKTRTTGSRYTRQILTLAPVLEIAVVARCSTSCIHR